MPLHRSPPVRLESCPEILFGNRSNVRQGGQSPCSRSLLCLQPGHRKTNHEEWQPSEDNVEQRDHDHQQN
jgi:hypothetical protein